MHTSTALPPGKNKLTVVIYGTAAFRLAKERMAHPIHDAVRRNIWEIEDKRGKESRREASLGGEDVEFDTARRVVSDLNGHVLANEKKLDVATVGLIKRAASALSAQIEIGSAQEEKYLALVGEVLKQCASLACYTPR